MKFNKIISSILKEELSREDRIKALKDMGSKKQYVVTSITGSYAHTPEAVVDSFGQKRTSQNLRVKYLKFEDYFNTRSLYRYIEVVFISLESTKDYYNSSEEALKEYLNLIPSEEGDQLYGIRNSAKDVTIAGIDYADEDEGSRLLVSFPIIEDELLKTFLKGVNIGHMQFMSRINNVEDDSTLWANSHKHLAEYFLNLPGNQRLN